MSIYVMEVLVNVMHSGRSPYLGNSTYWYSQIPRVWRSTKIYKNLYNI